jgi:hypothetical protein
MKTKTRRPSKAWQPAAQIVVHQPSPETFGLAVGDAGPTQAIGTDIIQFKRIDMLVKRVGYLRAELQYLFRQPHSDQASTIPG